MAARPSDGSWPCAATTVVGVIGDPVAHSLSPLIHNTAFGALHLDWVSVGFAVPAGAAAGAVAGMRALKLGGLSVTMPHKRAVADVVDACTPVAATLGAVNCLRWEGDRLIGDNTDGEGFVSSLRRGAGVDPEGLHCVVVGAGGAARAVILALAQAGAAEVVVVNRTAERAAAAAALAGERGRVGVAEDAARADLVVEATPAGMDGVAVVPLVAGGTLGRGQVAADLVYLPAVTPWLAAARDNGATIVGGLGMLVHQAVAQLRAWTGVEPPVETLWEAARQAVDGGGESTA